MAHAALQAIQALLNQHLGHVADRAAVLFGCRGLWVRSFESLGLNPQHREALAFALLAWWRQLGLPGSAPAITGARAGLLGQVAEP